MPEAASCQFIFLSEKKAWNNLQLSCICQDVHWIFQYFAQISPAAEFASEILILNHPIFIFCPKWSISQVNSHTTTLSVLDVMFLVSCSWLVSGGAVLQQKICKEELWPQKKNPQGLRFWWAAKRKGVNVFWVIIHIISSESSNSQPISFENIT